MSSACVLHSGRGGCEKMQCFRGFGYQLVPGGSWLVAAGILSNDELITVDAALAFPKSEPVRD